jgi:hypothetical protein
MAIGPRVDGNGPSRAVPADKDECRLWVQLSDLRRDARQRARRADRSRSSDDQNRGVPQLAVTRPTLA